MGQIGVVLDYKYPHWPLPVLLSTFPVVQETGGICCLDRECPIRGNTAVTAALTAALPAVL